MRRGAAEVSFNRLPPRAHGRGGGPPVIVAKLTGLRGAAAMTRRFLATAFLVLLAVPPGAAGAAPADPTAFIDEMGRRALDVLSNQAPAPVRQARFRELFRQDFDIPRIARFVLGRYWNAASPAEREEFQRLLEDYVVFAYSSRLSQYSGELFKVQGSRPDDGAVIVNSIIIRPGEDRPIRVDWRLVSENGALKIADVIIEGISMAVTQRSEFAAVIERSGGRVSGLLTVMREKTAAAR
jgi:phospholipid transport system substrate-binding protein